jgi:predicted patatin/cPLA2 family phospholipase
MTTAASVAHRPIHWALLLAIAILAGCGSVKREQRDANALVAVRETADQRDRENNHRFIEQLAKHVKSRADAHAAGKTSTAPTVDILIISGGGDWGAFGAGFLKGWKRIPASNPLAMPTFDGVTGVSTGALIAPFAFLSTDQSIESINRLYRNPQKDWVKQRGMLYFLPNHLSFAEVPGLEKELEKTVTLDMARQIADAGDSGRFCGVNTTNLDDAGPRVFDLVVESRRAVDTKDPSRLHNVMLASAGIPGAFPYREIDGEMYVDGGVTGNIIYGGRMSEEDSLPAVWQKMYPSQKMPKLRYWVIFNNQLRTYPVTVEAKWMPIISRSLELSTRSATVTAMRHLHAMAEISRLKRGADVEVRIVAIPGDWKPPKPGVFLKETMNNLADIGEKMGADPASWDTESP